MKVTITISIAIEMSVFDECGVCVYERADELNPKTSPF